MTNPFFPCFSRVFPVGFPVGFPMVTKHDIPPPKDLPVVVINIFVLHRTKQQCYRSIISIWVHRWRKDRCCCCCCCCCNRVCCVGVRWKETKRNEIKPTLLLVLLRARSRQCVRALLYHGSSLLGMDGCIDGLIDYWLLLNEVSVCCCWLLGIADVVLYQRARVLFVLPHSLSRQPNV